MKKQTKTLLIILGFFIFLALAFGAYTMLSQKTNNSAASLSNTNTTDAKTEPTFTAQEAPDFTVQDSNGNPITLSSLKGQPVILNFWASWCPPCKTEMPFLEKQFQSLGETVKFMMVDLVDGQRETKDIGAQFIKDNNYTFPVYFDTQQQGLEAYRITSIPTTFFIDKNGFVVYQVTGVVTEKSFQAGLDLIK